MCQVTRNTIPNKCQCYISPLTQVKSNYRRKKKGNAVLKYSMSPVSSIFNTSVTPEIPTLLKIVLGPVRLPRPLTWHLYIKQLFIPVSSSVFLGYFHTVENYIPAPRIRKKMHPVLLRCKIITIHCPCSHTLPWCFPRLVRLSLPP